MEKMKRLLKSIEVILLNNDNDNDNDHALASYSAVRFLLSDLNDRAKDINEDYPAITDINCKIKSIELNLLTYFKINEDDGFYDGQIKTLINNDLHGIKTILNRGHYEQ